MNTPVFKPSDAVDLMNDRITTLYQEIQGIAPTDSSTPAQADSVSAVPRAQTVLARSNNR